MNIRKMTEAELARDFDAIFDWLDDPEPRAVDLTGDDERPLYIVNAAAHDLHSRGLCGYPQTRSTRQKTFAIPLTVRNALSALPPLTMVI